MSGADEDEFLKETENTNKFGGGYTYFYHINFVVTIIILPRLTSKAVKEVAYQ
jgi:hypothetical protein